MPEAADLRFAASNDVGDQTDLVDDELDGTAGDEGGAVCDGDDNCAAIWDLNWAVFNTSTHFGIFLNTYEKGRVTL